MGSDNPSFWDCVLLGLILLLALATGHRFKKNGIS